MTQNERLVGYLSSGRSISAAQARSMFGIQRLSARIHDLRNEGFCVYTNVNNDGRTTYRLGTPSRQIVSAAYAVGGADFFGR